jgi:hypothetical protein
MRVKVRIAMDKITECNSLDYCPKVDRKTSTNCCNKSAKEMLEKFEKKLASNQWERPRPGRPPGSATGGTIASAKREPIWGSGGRAPVGFRGKAYISPRIYTTKYRVRTK